MKCEKTLGGGGSARDHARGANSAPPGLLAGGEGVGCRLTMNPTPALAFQASSIPPPNF